MSGCHTCGGFGYKHDPIAHGLEEERGFFTYDDDGRRVADEYHARRDVLARYLASECGQSAAAARIRASELMAIVATWMA